MKIIIRRSKDHKFLELTFRFTNKIDKSLKFFLIKGIKHTGNYRINNQTMQSVYKSDLPHVLTKLRDEIIKIETQNRA